MERIVVYQFTAVTSIVATMYKETLVIEKKEYKQPTAELVLFDNSDVVATSRIYCNHNFDGPGDNTCKQPSASAQ